MVQLVLSKPVSVQLLGRSLDGSDFAENPRYEE
jgi:hypothetical protein